MCAHVCLKLPQILAKMCYTADLLYFTAIESHLELNKCVSLCFAQCLKHVPSFSSCFQVHALGLCDYQINVCEDLPSSYTNKSVACDQMLLQGDWLLFYRGSTLYWDSQPPPPKCEIAISQSKVVPIVWVHPREKGLQVSNSLIWIWIRKKGEKKWPSTHSVFLSVFPSHDSLGWRSPSTLNKFIFMLSQITYELNWKIQYEILFKSLSVYMGEVRKEVQ